MKWSAGFTFCLTLILSLQAWSQGTSTASLKSSRNEKKFSAEWRLRLQGESHNDEQSQAKVFDLRTDLKAKYTLHSSLYLDLQPSLRLQSGQTQSVDGADKAENKIYLTQAAMVYRPFNVTRLSAGALNQRYLHTRLLLDEIAFPSARAEVLLTRGTLLSALALETAIPTSTSLSTNTRELEPTPSLNTVALKMNLQGSKELFLKFTGGYFIYNNLPSAVAQASRLLGNEVNALSEAQYTFAHKFEGVEGSLEWSVPVSTWMELVGYGEYVVNQKAPAELGTGYYYAAAGNFHVTSNMDLSLGGAYFSIAPEAAVSYFNARRFETNRIGYSAETMLSFKKEGFKVGAEFSESEVMFINSIQSKEQRIFLKLETFYADI